MSETQIDKTLHKNGKNFLINSAHIPQYFVCGILSLGGFVGGTVTGWSSPAIPFIYSSNHFPSLTTTNLAWIASIATLGSSAGSPLCGYLISKFGRKNSLIFSSIPYAIGYVALTFPFQIWMLYVGRFLVGFGYGVMLIAGSVYLSEIAEPELRGRLSVIWFVMMSIGTLFDYGVGSVLPYNLLSPFSALLSVAFGASTFFLPESPRWLISKSRKEDAIESLCWLQSCDKKIPSQNILDEIQEIEAAAQKAKEENEYLTVSSYITSGVVLKSVLIASTLMIFKEACGGNVFSYFTVQTFEKTGSPFDSHISGVIIGVAQVVGTTSAACFVDKIGRKILLLASFIIMTLTLIILSAFQQFKSEMDELSPNSGWIPLVSFMIYNWAYSGGPYVLAWTVSSEVIPTNVIGSVTGLATAIGWMSAFIMTRYYHDMIDGIGVSNSFWVFTAFSTIGTMCVYVLVPETVGRNLENIHKQIAGENGETREHSKQDDVQI
ncbi:unnamed protein product [Orchesella dallaii]|uniref:Major facilitator superfamily (MFS) profile domain-containing protein n=1 Tax=Orchesella dallaii TaxID=48710 RepID=A0ABP1RLL7_9HEXA